jgi:hypothetical protein
MVGEAREVQGRWGSDTIRLTQRTMMMKLD